MLHSQRLQRKACVERAYPQRRRRRGRNAEPSSAGCLQPGGSLAVGPQCRAGVEFGHRGFGQVAAGDGPLVVLVGSAGSVEVYPT